MFQTTNQYKYKCIVNYMYNHRCWLTDFQFAEFFSTVATLNQRPVGPGVWGALWQYRLSHPFATLQHHGSVMGMGYYWNIYIYGILMGYYWLVGGWALPSEKYEFVNGKDDIPNMKWKITFMFQNAPNHQPLAWMALTWKWPIWPFWNGKKHQESIVFAGFLDIFPIHWRMVPSQHGARTTDWSRLSTGLLAAAWTARR